MILLINEGNLSEISVIKPFSKDVTTNHYVKLLVQLCIDNELVTFVALSHATN